MALQLWQFSKRENSTAFPLTDAAYILDVVLKEATSILSPTWIIQRNPVGLLSMNYALWEGRYYNITDISILSNTICAISAEVDLCATYQEYILNTTTFVERANQHFDTYLSDYYVSQSTRLYPPSVFTSVLPPNFDSEGSFLVRTCGGGTAAATGISMYALNNDGLKALLSSLFTESNYDFLSDTSVKSFFNPFQYILDVKFFPFLSSSFGGGLERIKLGWWDTGVDATPVLDTSISYAIDVSMPESHYDDFRKYDSNWNTIRMFLPGSGLHFFNPAELGDTCRIRFDIDVSTGQGLIKVHPGTNESGFISVYNGQFCSPIAIGQLDNNAPRALISTLSTVGSAMTGNLIGATGGVINTIQNILQPTASINGTAGNMSALVDTPRVIVTRYEYQSKDIPQQVAGRPVMATKPLSMFNGYVKCGNANILIPGTDVERKQLNRILNGGFYIE